METHPASCWQPGWKLQRHVIASEATRLPSAQAEAISPGLLRRCAPRNDTQFYGGIRHVENIIIVQIAVSETFSQKIFGLAGYGYARIA